MLYDQARKTKDLCMVPHKTITFILKFKKIYLCWKWKIFFYHRDFVIVFFLNNIHFSSLYHYTLSLSRKETPPDTLSPQKATHGSFQQKKHSLIISLSQQKATHGRSPSVSSSSSSVCSSSSLGGAPAPGTRRSCLHERANADLPTRHPSA
jgi:hypothetical protein